MITTTAALDCQSNPNHITMIGCDSDDGNGTDQIAQRQQTATQERNSIGNNGGCKPGTVTDQKARNHSPHEGLFEIGSQGAR